MTGTGLFCQEVSFSSQVSFAWGRCVHSTGEWELLSRCKAGTGLAGARRVSQGGAGLRAGLHQAGREATLIGIKLF